MTPKDWIAVFAVVISGLSFLFSYLSKRGLDRDNLIARLIALETKMEVFWKNVSIGAAHILHSPHPENARTDYLLEQFRDDKITNEEERELMVALEKIINEKKEAPGILSAANSLLAIIKARNYVPLKK